VCRVVIVTDISVMRSLSLLPQREFEEIAQQRLLPGDASCGALRTWQLDYRRSAGGCAGFFPPQRQPRCSTSVVVVAELRQRPRQSIAREPRPGRADAGCGCDIQRIAPLAKSPTLSSAEKKSKKKKKTKKTGHYGESSALVVSASILPPDRPGRPSRSLIVQTVAGPVTYCGLARPPGTGRNSVPLSRTAC